MLYCLNNLNASATGTTCENVFWFFFILIQGDKKVKVCDIIVLHLELF